VSIEANILHNIRYDTIEEFNVDSKAERERTLNLAHVGRKNIKKRRN